MKDKILKTITILLLTAAVCAALCACGSPAAKPLESAAPSGAEAQAGQVQAKPEAPAFVPVPVTGREPLAEKPSPDGKYHIRNAEAMEWIARHPDADFVLDCDVDMQGAAWTPFAFGGTLDGRGHAISGLSVSGTGTETEKTYDGNMKVYDTYFCGMFSVLRGAEISSLELKDAVFECHTGEENVFAGTVAGFIYDSVIRDCRITASGELTTSSKCFGIGGIAGYTGRGSIADCSADVTLVCIDENREEKDEQFMGGAYAAGYANIDGCEIVIDGYDSDHGYVHNGGLVGMYIQYEPADKGSISRNRVSGMITFFEDNKNRRAYCEPYVGEMMSWNLAMDGNRQEFTRNEVFDYSTDLRPAR